MEGFVTNLPLETMQRCCLHTLQCAPRLGGWLVLNGRDVVDWECVFEYCLSVYDSHSELVVML